MDTAKRRVRLGKVRKNPVLIRLLNANEKPLMCV